MLTTAAAIITQTKPYEISAMSIHSVVKLNFSRLSVCLYNAPPQMTSHNALLLSMTLACYFRLPQIKIGMRSLCGQLTCTLFYQTIKHHIYDIPLQCKYVVSVHYKQEYWALL